MRILNLIILPYIALLAGCSSLHQEGRVGVLARDPNEFVFVSGDGQKEWYSGLELDQIARRYAYEKCLGFDFSEASRSVWINTNGRKVLANVSYSSEFGMPFLNIAIDRHGKVIRHETGMSVCGTSNR
jgi:hypothetical protein